MTIRNRGLSPLTAGTDLSGDITVGATAQTLVAANTGRLGLTIWNISDTDMWVSEGGTAAADTEGSVKIAAGTSYEVRTNRAISVIGATTGKKFTALEV